MPASPSVPIEELDSQTLPLDTSSNVLITGQNVYPYPSLPRRSPSLAASWKQTFHDVLHTYKDRPCIEQHTDHWAWSSFWSIVGNAGSYALLSSSFVAAALSFACVAVIVLLYSARVFTPANAHVVRPLYFDFTQPQAEATVNLLGAEPYTHYIHDLHELRAKGVVQPSGRFVAPGERLRVWLKLDVDDDDQPPDLFQVIGELRTLTGKPVARSSRPCMFHSETLLHRMLRLGAWPLSLTGMLDTRPSLRVDLFKTYTEKASAPFVEFRAVLHARAGGHPPPAVTAAELHVRLRLGLVRWLLSLFHLRTLPAIVTYLAAISMAFIFGGASVLLFVLWWATAKRRGKPALTVARPESVDLSDDSEVDIDGASAALSLGSEEDRESNIASSAAAPRVTDRWLADAGRNRAPLASGSLPPSSVTAASEFGEDTSESAVTVGGSQSLIPAMHRNGVDQSSEARQSSKTGFGNTAGHPAAAASLSRRRGGTIGGH